MGQNRRYGSDVTQEAINQAVIRPKPISLTPREAGEEVRQADDPPKVAAWVRFPEAAIEVQGRAIAWTDRAVLVEFTLHDGAKHQAWVWASAVQRR